jgi:lysophospholipase L1-like esterase
MKIALSRVWRNVLFRNVSAFVCAVTLLGSFTSFSSVAMASTLSPVFYLAIGGSESVGVQPTASDPNGSRTDEGYANDVVANEASLGVTLDLHEIGCPGETTTTMIYGGDTCYTPPDSQLNEAIAFLKSHQGESGLVTIDLGFNNVKTCLAHLSTLTTCLNQQTMVVSNQLTIIVNALTAVAGPKVTFVGLNHDDPYLADSLIGGDGPRISNASLSMVNDLNQTLRSVYSSLHIPIADVAAAFSLDVANSPKMKKNGAANLRSFEVCQLTWMCALAPYGPNLHPNDAGYLAIAGAIEAVLPPLS